MGLPGSAYMAASAGRGRLSACARSRPGREFRRAGAGARDLQQEQAAVLSAGEGGARALLGGLFEEQPQARAHAAGLGQGTAEVPQRGKHLGQQGPARVIEIDVAAHDDVGRGSGGFGVPDVSSGRRDFEDGPRAGPAVQLQPGASVENGHVVGFEGSGWRAVRTYGDVPPEHSDDLQLVTQRSTGDPAAVDGDGSGQCGTHSYEVQHVCQMIGGHPSGVAAPDAAAAFVIHSTIRSLGRSSVKSSIRLPCCFPAWLRADIVPMTQHFECVAILEPVAKGA